jgi:transcriptional regulator with GAF, ATPase, and Fis domain
LLLGLSPTLESPSANRSQDSEGGTALPASIGEARASWQEVSRWYLTRVLEKTENNYAQAARIVGLDRATVRRRAGR